MMYDDRDPGRLVLLAVGVRSFQATPMITKHRISIRPPQEMDLVEAAHLHPGEVAKVLGHLRWHAATPYARAVVAQFRSAVVGFGTAVHFGASARIAQLYVEPDLRGIGIGRAMAMHLITHMEKEGLATQLVQAAEQERGFWEKLGFVAESSFLHFDGGDFLQAQRDEVVLMEPAHTLALLHLDEQATGEDRSRLLLEHRYVAQAYVEQGRVRGGLLPVLGNGLIVADSPAVGLELQRWLLPTQQRIIVPAANSAACEHLQERKYKVVDTTLRMVRGALPQFRAEMVYAWAW